MHNKKHQLLDFEIDKLTNSIENVLTGDSFATVVLPLSLGDLKKVNKRNGWSFDWKSELNYSDRKVFKLTIVNNEEIVQGIISLSISNDLVYMHLIESAPFNLGKNKVYVGVSGNLIAFACKLSFANGTGGYISFRSKTRLIDHYIKALGAVHIGGHLMMIETRSALRLIEKYF